MDSPVAKNLANVPGVQMMEKNWVDITVDWLKEHEVVRAYVACHNNPNQFAEESTFLVNALYAQLEYVVRISTTAANVRPDCKAYYPRSHWAIEALLSSPEFNSLMWTSLQPNLYLQWGLAPAVDFIKKYRESRVQGRLSFTISKDTPMGLIDSNEIGIFAAHLLAQENPARHNKAKYVLNGPEDLTGAQVVEMVEQRTGIKVKDVGYEELLALAQASYEKVYANTGESKNVIMTGRHALETLWEGKCRASTTSKEVLEIAAPKRTPTDVLRAMLGEE
ncbi:NmrA-like family protein [Aspergillus caelatus]|uniref:NmrA-like family protein n=2 Tax=Aspergillus subgen. Circumdati TaxID=2720871 RepID=A0A5N7AF06_9EURO|nr:NmrA-like family protein [Aspergillus caelatus]KAE8368451.1 NmrA-like family protein [Aspergillus caelatus]